jgi:hypothetical protein
MMRSAVANPMPRTREGACLALAELIDNTSSDHLEAHEDTVIDAVRAALIDEDSAVRIAAARAFDALQEAIGPKTIERTIPTLLEAMRTPGEKSETALMALKEVMSVSLPSASSLAYGCEANPVRRNRSEPRPSSQLYYLLLQLSRLRRSTLGLWLHW